MRSTLAPAVAAFALGLVFWTFVSLREGVAEPWDAPRYWTVHYPLSLVISALAALAFKRHAWVSGLAITLAQLPVMAWQNGIGPLTIVGLGFAAVLAIPPMIVAATAVRLRDR